MSELEREMQRQREEVAARGRRNEEMEREGRANLRQFADLMRTNQVGRTTLYQCKTELVTPPPVKRFLRKPVSQERVFEDTFTLLGAGWTVVYDDWENHELYLVMEDGETYRCRRPKPAVPGKAYNGPYDRPDPSHLQLPYLVTNGPMTGTTDYWRFLGDLGLELLAGAARKHMGERK
ncbi:hypothetical protein FKR81_18255 [Lentzea tibetensis]|uniref:Uncharacterized protein n=1 Tax=Lentzea tibetensis TaxID=2591470 RepID=A0A563ETM3_9PSEU|nr:hypothetical protein [Lentzea tibetensis]TWP51010.1 hypothetical protein FKR81_18255 [Lentzea tibetensis]